MQHIVRGVHVQERGCCRFDEQLGILTRAWAGSSYLVHCVKGSLMLMDGVAHGVQCWSRAVQAWVRLKQQTSATTAWQRCRPAYAS